MRTVINGKGVDSSSGVMTYLQTNNQLYLANLYLIGNPEDPEAYWLTDWSTPLTWSFMGTFLPAVIPSRGSVKSQVGFEVTTMDFEWSPSNKTFTQSIAATSPYQKAWLGRFDGQPFRSWTCYMPQPGDADTFGCSQLFGGRIGNVVVERGSIKFTVNSFLDVVNQMVPGSVIETLNTIAGFKGATPPAGLSNIPTFTVVTASDTVIVATCTNPAGLTFATDIFVDGFMQFTSGSLVKMFSSISANTRVGSTSNNQFTVFTPFPWSPSTGDNFFVSATFPINQADGQYYGFPYVPDPNTAI